MIAYTQFTVQNAIDEMIIRMGNYRINSNIDWTTMLRYINRAVKEIMVKTLPYKDWAYTTQITVADATVLNNRFLKPIRLVVSATGTPPFVEARKVDAKEYYKITNVQQRNNWTRSTTAQPVYTLWGNANNNPTQLVIYITPTTSTGTLDCHVAPVDLTAGTDIIPIPYEFKNLVILSALSRVYFKSKDKDIVMMLKDEIAKERVKISELYMEKRRTEERELDSFVEPLVPLVPDKEEQGELPKQLS